MIDKYERIRCLCIDSALNIYKKSEKRELFIQEEA